MTERRLTRNGIGCRIALALFLLLAPLAVRMAHARKAVVYAPPPAVVPSFCCPPDTTITSSDGRFAAASWRMKQEGYSSLLLFEGRQLIRAWTGLRAVAWEPEGTRLLVVESLPDDDLDYYILDPAVGGDHPDMPELARLFTVAKTSERFLAWKKTGELVFQNGLDPDVQRSVWIKKKDD